MCPPPTHTERGGVAGGSHSEKMKFLKSFFFLPFLSPFLFLPFSFSVWFMHSGCLYVYMCMHVHLEARGPRVPLTLAFPLTPSGGKVSHGSGSWPVWQFWLPEEFVAVSSCLCSLTLELLVCVDASLLHGCLRFELRSSCLLATALTHSHSPSLYLKRRSQTLSFRHILLCHSLGHKK